MAKSLVYVNKDKIVGLSAPFIGSEINLVHQISASGGFNWLLQGEVSSVRQKSTVMQIRDLLPETIAAKLLEKFPSELTFDSVDSCTKKLKEWEQEDNIGKPILVRGVLRIPNLNVNTSYDPINPPSFNEVRRVSYNGTQCFVCELTDDGLTLPVYFSEDAISMIAYCSSKYVDVMGVLNFAPWYDVGKSRTINTIVTGVAAWIR